MGFDLGDYAFTAAANGLCRAAGFASSLKDPVKQPAAVFLSAIRRCVTINASLNARAKTQGLRFSPSCTIRFYVADNAEREWKAGRRPAPYYLERQAGRGIC